MLSYKEYDNALAVEIVIKGFVSTQEFEDTAKKLEAFIARHGKVNVLEVIEDFEGMDGTAFWQDFKFSLAHLNDFSRCAIVSDGKWVTPWSEIVAPFFKGEVRYFPPDEIEGRARVAVVCWRQRASVRLGIAPNQLPLFGPSLRPGFRPPPAASLPAASLFALRRHSRGPV